MARMQPVRIPHKLPVVLSREEVGRLIAAGGNLKHQTALALAYGTGLRASEVGALKVGDIDRERMTLRVEQGKGQREHLCRFVTLRPRSQCSETSTRRSNPHSASLTLSASAAFRGFLPGALSNACPQAASDMPLPSRLGRRRTNLNQSSRSLVEP